MPAGAMPVESNLIAAIYLTGTEANALLQADAWLKLLDLNEQIAKHQFRDLGAVCGILGPGDTVRLVQVTNLAAAVDKEGVIDFTKSRFACRDGNSCFMENCTRLSNLLPPSIQLEESTNMIASQWQAALQQLEQRVAEGQCMGQPVTPQLSPKQVVQTMLRLWTFHYCYQLLLPVHQLLTTHHYNMTQLPVLLTHLRPQNNTSITTSHSSSGGSGRDPSSVDWSQLLHCDQRPMQAEVERAWRDVLPAMPQQDFLSMLHLLATAMVNVQHLAEQKLETRLFELLQQQRQQLQSDQHQQQQLQVNEGAIQQQQRQQQQVAALKRATAEVNESQDESSPVSKRPRTRSEDNQPAAAPPASAVHASTMKSDLSTAAEVPSTTADAAAAGTTSADPVAAALPPPPPPPAAAAVPSSPISTTDPPPTPSPAAAAAAAKSPAAATKSPAAAAAAPKLAPPPAAAAGKVPQSSRPAARKVSKNSRTAAAAPSPAPTNMVNKSGQKPQAAAMTAPPPPLSPPPTSAASKRIAVDKPLVTTATKKAGTAARQVSTTPPSKLTTGQPKTPSKEPTAALKSHKTPAAAAAAAGGGGSEAAEPATATPRPSSVAGGATQQSAVAQTAADTAITQSAKPQQQSAKQKQQQPGSGDSGAMLSHLVASTAAAAAGGGGGPIAVSAPADIRPPDTAGSSSAEVPATAAQDSEAFKAAILKLSQASAGMKLAALEAAAKAVFTNHRAAANKMVFAAAISLHKKLQLLGLPKIMVSVLVAACKPMQELLPAVDRNVRDEVAAALLFQRDDIFLKPQARYNLYLSIGLQENFREVLLREPQVQALVAAYKNELRRLARSSELRKGTAGFTTVGVDFGTAGGPGLLKEPLATMNTQLFSTFRQFLEAVMKDDDDFDIVQHFTSYRLILTEQFLDYYRQYSKLLLGRREVVELLPVIADAVVDELQNRALGNHQLGVPRSTLDHVSDQLRMHPKLSNIKAYLMAPFFVGRLFTETPLLTDTFWSGECKDPENTDGGVIRYIELRASAARRRGLRLVQCRAWRRVVEGGGEVLSCRHGWNCYHCHAPPDG